MMKPQSDGLPWEYHPKDVAGELWSYGTGLEAILNTVAVHGVFTPSNAHCNSLACKEKQFGGHLPTSALHTPILPIILLGGSDIFDALNVRFVSAKSG